VRHLLFALVVAQVLAGACALARNLGKVPHYGDTRAGVAGTLSPAAAPGYVRLAHDGSADSRRGLLYPVFLRLVHDAGGGPWFEGLDLEDRQRMPKHAIDCWAPAWQMRAQLLQLAVFAAALVFAGAVFTRRRLTSRWPPLLLALVYVDPVLVHAQLSLLPDGLSLSACLLFLAGFVEYTRDGKKCGLLLLLLGATLAAGLRPEKGLVLGSACALTMAGLALWRTRPPRSRFRALLATAGVFVAAAAFAGAGRWLERWTVAETVVHARIVYPRLEAIHAALPEDAQRRIPLDLARRYDTSIQEGRQVVHQATEGDAAVRRALTAELRRVALRERWLAIGIDCSIDSLRNLAATPEFLVRLATWAWHDREVAGRSADRRWESVGSWLMLSYHEPDWSLVSLVGAIAVLLVGWVLGAERVLHATRSGAWRRAPWAAVLPVAAFLAVNAAAFGFTQDLFDLRYVYPSHLAWVALGCAGAVASLQPRSPASS